MLISRIAIAPASYNFGKKKNDYDTLINVQRRIDEIDDIIDKAYHGEIQISKKRLNRLKRERAFHETGRKIIGNRVIELLCDSNFADRAESHAIEDSPYLNQDVFHKKNNVE